MFHMKDDIRVTRSAQMLCDALMEILEKKTLNEVTVSELSKRSTVSRATFYRNFDEVIDILYWKCEMCFKEVLGDFTESDPDLTKEDVLLLFVLRYWLKKEHMQILEKVIEVGRLDIIYNSFVDNAGILMDYLKERGLPMDTRDYTYFISVRAGFFTGIIRGWIKNGRKETPEELTEIIRRQHDDVMRSGLLI